MNNDSLTIIVPPTRRPTRHDRWRPWLLRLYRLAVLVAIVWLIREHHAWVRHREDHPITVAEVQKFIPTADRLVVDRGPQRGRRILDAMGIGVGYAVRTAPHADSIIGYCGSTDTLMVFGPDRRLIGISMRRSWDTTIHSEDVATDRYFMNLFNGMTWDDIAQLDIQAAGVEGVSGSTMTSMCMVEGMRYRLGEAVENHRPPPRQLRTGARDVGLLLVVAVAIAMSLTRLARRKWLRRTFQVVVIAYLGFYLGDMVALPLLIGWAQSRVPWDTAPGLVLLIAAALMLPFFTRRPTYCSHICPHGAAQELLGRVNRRKWRVPKGLNDGLRWLPLLLLVFALMATMLVVPIDLANIEPFDAYMIRSAAWVTITIALVGLAASLVVPQAYCKYGCPTGAVLELVRSHGRADRFNRRDAIAALLLAVATVLFWHRETIYSLIHGR